MTSVMTVRGPIDVESLGILLPHEHVFSNALIEYRATGGLLNDEQLAIEELTRFVTAGGSGIVDLTLDEIGRQPSALKRVSEATNLHVIMGRGHYRDPYLDHDWFDRMSVDDIASEMIRDIEYGVGSSGVRAGIIGEIGSDKAYISAAEERSFRAAARAQKASGLTISTHAARWPVGLLQLDILESEGVNTERVIIGHADTVPDRAYHRAIVERGAFVSFDGFGTESPYEEERSIKSIIELVADGFEGKILVSQDIFQKSQLHAYGGNGYDYVLTSLLPRLQEVGVPRNSLERIIGRNPGHALTGESG